MLKEEWVMRKSNYKVYEQKQLCQEEKLACVLKAGFISEFVVAISLSTGESCCQTIRKAKEWLKYNQKWRGYKSYSH